MARAWQFQFESRNHALSWRVWIGTRLAGIIIGLLAILAIALHRPSTAQQEPPVIQSVTLDADFERAEPVAVPTPPQQSPKAQPQPKPLRDDRSASPVVQESDAFPDRTPVATAPNAAPAMVQSPQIPRTGPQTLPTPNIANAPGAVARPGTEVGSDGPPARTLTSGTLALLRARECARIDERDRPPNCPPNDELMRLLAKERDPKYRPENAEAFSRNEQAWRGVPPPCLDDGQSVSTSTGRLCVRVGTPPSRVRSAREICEARGLGGCSDVPAQSAINAANEQVRQLSPGKQKAP